MDNNYYVICKCSRTGTIAAFEGPVISGLRNSGGGSGGTGGTGVTNWGASELILSNCSCVNDLILMDIVVRKDNLFCVLSILQFKIWCKT